MLDLQATPSVYLFHLPCRLPRRGSRRVAVLPDRHDDGLFRLCFRFTGHRETAGDLTRDICLALPARLQNFRGEAKSTTWLYRVAVSTTVIRRTSGSGT